MPTLWEKLNQLVDIHEEYWSRLGHHWTDRSEGGQALLHFFHEKWDPWYSKILQYRQRRLPDSAAKEGAQGLSQLRAFAARDYGLPVPDIGSRGPSSDPYTLTSGGSMSRVSCQVALQGSTLLVQCRLPNGKLLSRSIDLHPIQERIKAMIANYHSEILRGDMDEDTISGIGEWYNDAANTAARVATAKAMRDIRTEIGFGWSDIASVAKDAGNFVDHHRGDIASAADSVYPGAGKVISTGFKVYDTIQSAQAGDPKAHAQIQRVKIAAKQGDPNAQDIMAMMRAILAKMEAKEAASTKVSGWADGMMRRQLLERQRKAAARRSGVSHDNRRKHGGWKGSGSRGVPQRRESADSYREQYEDQDQGYDDQGQLGQGDDVQGWYSIEDHEDYWENDAAFEADRPDYSQSYDVASGWLYNRPYRSTSDTLVQVERSPGIGLGLRELYNLGLGKPKTTRETILLSASPDAAKIYQTVKKMGADHPTAMAYVKRGLAYLQSL